MQHVYVFQHELVSVRGSEHGRFNRLVSNKKMLPSSSVSLASCLCLQLLASNRGQRSR